MADNCNIELSGDPQTWGPAQVAQYLRSVHLAENYVKVFEEEEINGFVLMSLERHELKDEPFNMKGFSPVKTVLACIDTLKSMHEKAVADAAAPAAAAPAAAAAAAAAAAPAAATAAAAAPVPSSGASPATAAATAEEGDTWSSQQQQLQLQQQQQQAWEMGQPDFAFYPPHMMGWPYEPNPFTFDGGVYGGMRMRGSLPQPPSGMAWPQCPPPPIFPQGMTTELLNQQQRHPESEEA